MGTAFSPNTGVSLQLIHVTEERANTTAAGTFTSGSYTPRSLATIRLNEIPGASLASSVLSLPAGTYHCEARAPAGFVDAHKARLRDTSNSIDLLIGSNSNDGAGGEFIMSNSDISGKFVLTAQTNVELQHRCATTKASDGLGRASSFGDSEVYAEIKLWREIPATNDGNGELVNGPLFHAQGQKPNNTHGGTLTAGSWQTRELEVVITSAIVGGSLASDQITLPAGSYYIEATAPAYRVDANRLRIQDTTGATSLLTGPCYQAANLDSVGTMANVHGQFTLGSTSVIELQHQSQTTFATIGLGTRCAFGIDETYAEVRIWKLVKAGANDADVVNSPLLHVRDEKANTTQGGTPSIGSWDTRDLNTVVTNEVGASLSSNVITLLSGTYYIEASAPCYRGNSHTIRVRKTTATAATLVHGDNEFSGNVSNSAVTRANARGQFSLTATSDIEIQHWIGANGGGDGLGVTTSVTGGTERYTEVRIWKLS